MPIFCCLLGCFLLLACEPQADGGNPSFSSAGDSKGIMKNVEETVSGVVADERTTEAVRKGLHMYIDLQASVMKLKVDALLAVWGTLTPEQKKQAVSTAFRAIEAGQAELEERLSELRSKDPGKG